MNLIIERGEEGGFATLDGALDAMEQDFRNAALRKAAE